MFTTKLSILDRETSTVIFKQTYTRKFQSTKQAEKYLYNLVNDMEIFGKNLWVVGGIWNSDGKLEYNIGLL